MTREEIVKFIEDAIYGNRFPVPMSGPMRESIEKIADRWEEDVEVTREYSIADGRDTVDLETIYRFAEPE